MNRHSALHLDCGSLLPLSRCSRLSGSKAAASRRTPKHFKSRRRGFLRLPATGCLPHRCCPGQSECRAVRRLKKRKGKGPFVVLSCSKLSCPGATAARPDCRGCPRPIALQTRSAPWSSGPAPWRPGPIPSSASSSFRAFFLLLRALGALPFKSPFHASCLSPHFLHLTP